MGWKLFDHRSIMWYLNLKWNESKVRLATAFILESTFPKSIEPKSIRVKNIMPRCKHKKRDEIFQYESCDENLLPKSIGSNRILAIYESTISMRKFSLAATYAIKFKFSSL